MTALHRRIAKASKHRSQGYRSRGLIQYIFRVVQTACRYLCTGPDWCILRSCIISPLRLYDIQTPTPPLVRLLSDRAPLGRAGRLLCVGVGSPLKMMRSTAAIMIFFLRRPSILVSAFSSTSRRRANIAARDIAAAVS